MFHALKDNITCLGLWRQQQDVSPRVRTSFSTQLCGVMNFSGLLHCSCLFFHHCSNTPSKLVLTHTFERFILLSLIIQLPYKINASISLLLTKILQAFTPLLSNPIVITSSLDPRWSLNTCSHSHEGSLNETFPFQTQSPPIKLASCLPLGYSSLPNSCARKIWTMLMLSEPFLIQRDVRLCFFNETVSLSLLLQFFNHCLIKPCSHKMRSIDYYII